MNIIITMAGLGSRFKKAGYNEPKYMIKVKGKTLFEWSMESLSAFKNEFHIFLVRKADNAKKFIEENCKLMGINNTYVIELETLTRGQAETAMLASECWNEDEALFVYNIDTYVESGVLSSNLIKGDGFIPCFEAQGNHWSFVRLGPNGEACEVREKQRISSNCSIGAYYFRTCKLYAEIYKMYYDVQGNLEKGERYIAPMYNMLIDKGGKVFIQNIPSRCVHVLGTPEEVYSFASQ